MYRAPAPWVSATLNGDVDKGQLIVPLLRKGGPTGDKAEFSIRFVRETAILVQERIARPGSAGLVG